jgi:NAD(P)-dependent dehydrogenase (short-subunit alcohol dehydrogenase family)
MTPLVPLMEFLREFLAGAFAGDLHAKRFTDNLGPIDKWVNDAMLTVFSLVGDLSAEEFRQVTEVTYLDVDFGTMTALRPMRGCDSGGIINVGSALAYRGIPLQAAYCGAEHGVHELTASVRSDLESASSQIAISIDGSPAMNTPQFDWASTHRPHLPRPMGTIYQPEVAAKAVFRAACNGAPEYWVGASIVMTIVGNMVAPRLGDKGSGSARPDAAWSARQSLRAGVGSAPQAGII